MLEEIMLEEAIILFLGTAAALIILFISRRFS